MEVRSINPADGTNSSAQLSDVTFAREYNEALIHQVINAYIAESHTGTKRQKNRSDVRGGSKKPWRQKGTGRARAGSSTGPIWRGGGVTFAARPESRSLKLNKKMYRGAMQSILSELVRQERIKFIDTIVVDAPKTSILVSQLKSLDIKQALIVTDTVDENLYLSARNIKNVEVRDAKGVDPVVLLSYPVVVMTVAAAKQFEEFLG